MSGGVLSTRNDSSTESVANKADPIKRHVHATVDVPGHIVDAAIHWTIKLDHSHATPDTRRAFELWLAADPLHTEAWNRVQSLSQVFETLPKRLALDSLEAVNTARKESGVSRRHALKLLSLAGVTVTVGWITHQHAPWQRLLADANTATGEQKTLQLIDGTVLVLNTDSAVSTDLSGDHRLVALRRGEMMITTGPDTAAASRAGQRRPFWVGTPYGRLRALGTRFTVRLDDQRARVCVLEGLVELHPRSGGELAVVRPGENRWLSADGTAATTPLPFEADGFAEGVISGKEMRLADLLSELARYRHGRIVCDERVAGLPVSGLFHVNNTDQVLQFLAQTQPISITYRTRLWVIVGPKVSAA